MHMLAFASLSLALLFDPVDQGKITDTRTHELTYAQCIEVVGDLTSHFGLTPEETFESQDQRVFRFVVSDGDLSITCDRRRHQMIVTKREVRRE